jgi:poly(A) polymerase
MHDLLMPKDHPFCYEMSASSSPSPTPPLSSSPASSVEDTDAAAAAAHRLSVAELTASLDAVLHSEKCYETEEGLVKRREVLKQLNVLVKQWIQSVSLTRGMHWSDIDKIGGRIVTYGSYMLGISHQGADIDALCIAPQHITR